MENISGLQESIPNLFRGPQCNSREKTKVARFTLNVPMFLYMAGSVLIWAPPGRGRRVPGARNGPFGRRKTQGRVFGPEKNPCGNGDTQFLGFQ